MKGLFFILLLFPQEGELQKTERERISSKKALSEIERSFYQSPRFPQKRSIRKTYNLAVLPLSFSDEKHTTFDPLFWADLRDYYATQSKGQFRISVKQYPALPVDFTWKQMSLQGIRSEGETQTLRKAIRTWISKVGEAVLALHDGVLFYTAGSLGPRGGALWPHQGSLPINQIRFPYVVLPSVGGKYRNGIAAHEFGHFLGLQDRYKMEGLCLMGTGYEQIPPAPLCSFCQEELGWIKGGSLPAGESGKVVLHERELLRVPVNPGKTEYMVLSVRNEKLRIWREGPLDVREFIGTFPSDTSDRCTPLSVPGFVGTSMGSRELWVTDIRSEKDAIWFSLAPSGEATPWESARQKSIGQRLGP